jgi:hypothetical protein
MKQNEEYGAKAMLAKKSSTRSTMSTTGSKTHFCDDMSSD